jgi:uncharacterized protein YegP (UPF0339 family)
MNSAKQQTSSKTKLFKIQWFNVKDADDYIDKKRGKWYFRVVSRSNGRIVAQSEGYNSKQAMLKTAAKFGFDVEELK